jgi:hypothetical protein
MAQIESESEKQEHRFVNFFVPSFSEVLLYLLLGGILLVIFNSRTLLNWLGTNYIGSPQNLKLNLDIVNNSVSSSLSSSFGGRLGQIIVWSLIGALAYIALWFLKNILNSFENDVIINHYLHPKSFNRAGYWGSAFSSKIFFGALFILFIGYTYALFTIIFPAISALCASAVYHFELPVSVLYILLCIFVAGAAIYLWVILMRLISHLWKLL